MTVPITETCFFWLFLPLRALGSQPEVHVNITQLQSIAMTLAQNRSNGIIFRVEKHKLRYQTFVLFIYSQWWW